MAKFCSHCGAELNDSDNFCPHCGKTISEQATGHTKQTRDIGIAENLFRRDGRLNRWRYFKRCFLLNIAAFIILLIGFVMLGNHGSDDISTAQDVWLKVVVLVELIPQFCLMTRRLHDMDNDETLAYVIVALNVCNVLTLDYSSNSMSVLDEILGSVQFLVGMYILLGHGTKGDNKYGADPLENQS